jgi:hypothetical protein
MDLIPFKLCFLIDLVQISIYNYKFNSWMLRHQHFQWGAKLF